MYTQCPSCDTVYRVTTEQIKLAKGDVRCGRCQVMFNALERLTDHVPPPRLPGMEPRRQHPDSRSPEAPDPAPEAVTPEAVAPETETPEAGTPEAGTPEAETPEAKTPEAETAEAETPEAETPEAETPEAETPEAETPEAETPEAETPEAETPEAETPEAETAESETPEAETPEAETAEAETPEAETPEAETPEIETPEIETPEFGIPEFEIPAAEAPAAEIPEIESAALQGAAPASPVTEALPAPTEPEAAAEQQRPAPRPRHPMADQVPAGAASAWVAVATLRQPRPRPARAARPPVDPAAAAARAKAAAVAAVMMPAGAPALWNATAAMLEPPPRRPRMRIETAPAEASRPVSRPAVDAPWIPPAAPGAWVATAEMLAPPPRPVLPASSPPQLHLDDEHAATIAGIDVAISPAAFVPAAAASAWHAPREMRGPLRRRTSADIAPKPDVETPAMAAEQANLEDDVRGRHAQAAPEDIEEIVLETAAPSHDASQTESTGIEQPEDAPPADTDAQATVASPRPAEVTLPVSDRFSDDEDDLPEELKLPGRKIPRAWLTWGAAVLGILIIAGAIVHKNRSELMRSPAMASLLGGIYSAIGVTAMPAWEPRQFVIQESSAEADSQGRLVVTASFSNEADFAQPYPILRVTLENRWGQSVSEQDFAPSAYLPNFIDGRLLGAGDRTDAVVSMQVPDREAVGFNLNLCLELDRAAFVCAVD